MVAEQEIHEQLEKLENATRLLNDTMKGSTVADMGRMCQDIMDDSMATHMALEGSAEEVILGGNAELFDHITTALNSFTMTQEKLNFWMVGENVEIDGVEYNGVTPIGAAEPERNENVGAIDERLMTSSPAEGGGNADPAEGSKKKVKKEKKTPKKDQKKDAVSPPVADEGLGGDFGGWGSWGGMEGGDGAFPPDNDNQQSMNEAWPPPQNASTPAVAGGDGFPDFFEEPGGSEFVPKQHGNTSMDPADFGFPSDTVVEQPYNSKEAGSRVRPNPTISSSERPQPVGATERVSTQNDGTGFGAFPTDTGNKTHTTSPAQNQRFSPRARDQASFDMGDVDYPSLESPAPWQSPRSQPKSKSYDEGAPGSVSLQMRLPNVSMDMITADFHKQFQEHLAQALDISSARIRINSVKPVSSM